MSNRTRRAHDIGKYQLAPGPSKGKFQAQYKGAITVVLATTHCHICCRFGLCDRGLSAGKAGLNRKRDTEGVKRDKRCPRDGRVDGARALKNKSKCPGIR